MKRLVPVAAALLLFAACARETADTSRAAVALTRDYLIALSQSRLKHALSLECPALRATVTDDALEQELTNYLKEIGKISSVAARAEPVTHHPAAGRAVAQVRYTVVRRGHTSAPMSFVFTEVKGVLKLCGVWTLNGAQIARQVKAEVVTTHTPSVSLRRLMPALPAGALERHNGPFARTDKSPGEQEDWTLWWETSTFDAGFVSARLFDTHAHAIAATPRFNKQFENIALNKIRSEFGSGVRMLGFSWSGVQTPDVGPFTEAIDSVLGTVLVRVVVTGDPEAAGRAGEILDGIVRSIVPARP